MPITLKHLGTGESVDLSDRLVWPDEFARNPVAAEQRWGTTGALMLHVGVRQAGLPITLEGVESQAWLTRAVVQQLDAWAQRARTWAAGGEPDDLPRVEPAVKRKASPREVFVFFIGAAKARNPAAAMALQKRL